MSAVGIDLMTVDARVVVASLDTYLMRADAVGGIAWDQLPVPMQVARTVARGNMPIRQICRPLGRWSK